MRKLIIASLLILGLSGKSYAAPLQLIHETTGTYNSAKAQSAQIKLSTGGFNVMIATTAMVTSSFTAKGTVIGDNAAAGNLGQYVSSVTAALTSDAASGNSQNFAQILLSPGDWDISGCIACSLNGATMSEQQVAVSSFSAGTSTDHIEGDNSFEFTAFPNASGDSGFCIPVWRQNITGNTTYYLKYTASYSAGPPKARGRISARRVR